MWQGSSISACQIDLPEFNLLNIITSPVFLGNSQKYSNKLTALVNRQGEYFRILWAEVWSATVALWVEEWSATDVLWVEEWSATDTLWIEEWSATDVLWIEEWSATDVLWVEV